MRYADRPEFPCDPNVFGLADTQTALRIYDEAVMKFGGRRPPIFFEVDRDAENLDPLWHAPLSGRDKVLRRFELPAINRFIRNEWMMTKFGIVPQRHDDFTISHLSLIRLDYFPNRGDYLLWNGYRYMVIHVEIPGEAYWQQTNVWLGLLLKCMVPPDGDGRPSAPTADELRQARLPSLATTPVSSPPDVPGQATV